MLQAQQLINKNSLAECEGIRKNARKMQHEYELRIEEYVRLLDIRKNKIDKLQSQLHSLGMEELSTPVDNAEFRSGANKLTIEIKAAILAEDIQNHLMHDLKSVESLTSFCFIDFFEFGTETTPLGLGRKPIYNHSIK